MNNHIYKGFRIQISLLELRAASWRSRVGIEWSEGDSEIVSPIETLSSIFETEEAAQEAALQRGKQLVDERLA